MSSNNKILELSLSFSLEIIPYCELLKMNKNYVISKQLLKSVSLIGINI